MVGSEGWQFVAQEIRKKINYHRTRLMDCETWDEVQQHRGSVEALESVLVHVDQNIRAEEVDSE